MNRELDFQNFNYFVENTRLKENDKDVQNEYDYLKKSKNIKI